MVIWLHSRYYHALHSFIGFLSSSWHIVYNQLQAQAEDVYVTGHSVKDMTPTKVVIADL
jgi:hypothetical protein